MTPWDGDEHVRCAQDFRLVAYKIPRGTAAAYYPERNPLVPLDSTALKSNQPASKSVVVRLTTAGSEGCVPEGAQGAVGGDWSHKSHPEVPHLS
ncbi:putative formate dehydrogenase oxidoreductase protein [Pseudonocardia sp. Ae168_Ps1]|nr:putative formate dehydrogenase oxidoreductase protein [Pseudonocardia sp. Ae168_Ps1]OLL76989.1 putative formate dehydrogenase oxidoreductase protein [Pseudonocardia sp. Ae150A_Ps1]OLL88899.1 putative formate dehydrogenase oxidoreductase protein [Pseudonocardia sp. Ae263_Ps1]OLL91076.1 putative formate dehydrogenase oxidoreductase protein [Pseudonocardia sp. Ae356_Ps1]